MISEATLTFRGKRRPYLFDFAVSENSEIQTNENLIFERSVMRRTQGKKRIISSTNFGLMALGYTKTYAS